MTIIYAHQRYYARVIDCIIISIYNINVADDLYNILLYYYYNTYLIVI